MRTTRLSSAVLFSQQQHCSLHLLCLTMCENNEEMSGSEDEQNRNMWNGVLSLLTDFFTGPWVQICLRDEEFGPRAADMQWVVYAVNFMRYEREPSAFLIADVFGVSVVGSKCWLSEWGAERL